MTTAIEAAARLACERLVAQGKPLVEANVLAEFAAMYVKACLIAAKLRAQIENERDGKNRPANPLVKAETTSTYAEMPGLGGKVDEKYLAPSETQTALAFSEAPLVRVSARKTAGSAPTPADPWVTRQQANADLDMPAVLRRA